jgi:hypothetical protein
MSVSILQALDDKRLFGSAFRDKATWRPWRAFLAALFGLSLSEAEEDIYRQCTGRSEAPTGVFRQGWLICGRRAGKSFILALIAVYLACFRDYRPYLNKGERAVVMVVSADREQAKIILRYIKGLVAVPALARLIEGETADSIDLGRVTIEVVAAHFRSVRGRTVCAGIFDELAFLPQADSASPDEEILAALRPAMLTIPNSVLLCSSSPYARRGALWDTFKRYYGSADPNILVWKAPTKVMNPTVEQSYIDEEMEKDSAKATAEYYAEFRTDVDSYVSREVVEACVDDGVFERAPISSLRYFGMTDPSGGSGADSFTVAVTHMEKDQVLVDAIRERKPPFSPETVAKEFAEFLLSYRVTTVRGDRWAGEWPREQFRKHGVSYVPADKTRSELYLEMLPRLNARRVSLLDNKRLIEQLVGLERRTSTAGKDSVNHADGGHDDVANAVAGAIVYAATTAKMRWVAPIITGERPSWSDSQLTLDAGSASTNPAIASGWHPGRS